MTKKLAIHFLYFALASLFSGQLYSADGKLLGTAALIQIEGTSGGGIVPWATLAGYDSQEEYSANSAIARVSTNDYALHTLAFATSFRDRIELSVARQTFDLSSLGGEINQNIVGVKARLYGDIIYSEWPQISLGIQYKNLSNQNIANALGAKKADQGIDVYIAATKVHVDALFGHNLVWNLAVRGTKANQGGLLGFGGEKNDSYEPMLEGSLGVFLSRSIAVGMEYRQKPDNLATKEDDWKDVFITYLPNKHVSLTGAWVDLGNIAGAANQKGLYVSLAGYF